MQGVTGTGSSLRSLLSKFLIVICCMIFKQSLSFQSNCKSKSTKCFSGGSHQIRLSCKVFFFLANVFYHAVSLNKSRSLCVIEYQNPLCNRSSLKLILNLGFKNH